MSLARNAGEEADSLIVSRAEGLYCPAGDFHIDPWRPVARAVITHAHADHARAGHAHYLCSLEGEPIMRARLGDVSLQSLAYSERLRIGDAIVSLHPAGHVRGSAQVRIEVRGEVWVVAGDYKLAPDPTCTAFEPVRCRTFITESTFGLPIYRWQPAAQLLAEIHEWWQDNAATGRASLIYCYALGKAQRILAGLLHLLGDETASAPGPLLVHGAIDSLNRVYRGAGITLPQTAHATGFSDRALIGRALVLAPPSASGTPWPRRFGDHASAFASGWMRVRGARRQRGVERGFVLSDHADWPGLLQAIEATGAEQVWVTHGLVEPLVRYLRSQGLRSAALATEYGAEEGTAAAEEAAATAEGVAASPEDLAAADAPSAADDMPDA